MKHIIFDIETGPLTEDQIEAVLEYKPHAGIKDPEKIEAHRLAQRDKALEKAALNPLTGRVLAIGFGSILIWSDADDEKKVLKAFWKQCDRVPVNLVGFNILGFDIPFLVRRSWILGVPVPWWVREGRYWSDRFIDLRQIWLLGDYQGEGSLDTLCRAMGIGAKNGDGAQFAYLWENDRQKAIEYVQNEIAITTALAKRLGVV